MITHGWEQPYVTLCSTVGHTAGEEIGQLAMMSLVKNADIGYWRHQEQTQIQDTRATIRSSCAHTLILSFASYWSRSNWTTPYWSTGLTTLLTYQSVTLVWIHNSIGFLFFCPVSVAQSHKTSIETNNFLQHLQTHSKPAPTTQSNPSCFKCSNTFEFLIQSPVPSLSLYPLSSTSSL